MHKATLIFTSTLLAASVAYAHSGVKDKQVMARMMGMDAIASASKTLGSMARGRIDFNAEDAAAAKASLIEHATAIPLVFADPASDPKSEALPVIWERFDDFSAKAETLRAAAEALDVTSAASIADGMGAVGGTCRSCHSTYRQ